MLRNLRARLRYKATPPLLAVIAVALALLGKTGDNRLAWAAETDAARGSARGVVIFAYTRFGEDRYPSTSITLDQFEAHVQELKSGEYNVLPLSKVVELLQAGGAGLPDRAVAITIDDAWISVYREAFSRLRAATLPFTLFVSPGAIDRESPVHMNWDQVREMARAGVTIGLLPGSPRPIPERHINEVRADIRESAERLREELGAMPTLFAYPYGEYTLAARDAVAKLGMVAAFGQQSGVAHARQDRLTLPRFPMNESHGSLERFRLAANALPLPVDDVTPNDPVLSANPPNLGFTVPGPVDNLDRLACFATGQGRARVEHLDEQRVEVRIADPLSPGRARVNCTLPASEGRWHWFGVQFFIPPVTAP